MNNIELNTWRERIKKDVSCLIEAPQAITSNFDFMKDALNINIKAFNYADVILKSSRPFLKEVIERDGLLLRYASKELQLDLDLVVPALKNNGLLFKYLPTEVKINKNAICAAISSPRGDFLLEAANKIKDNRELMLFAVSCRGTNLMFASERLRDDKEMVMAAVNQNWLALGFASSNLKGNIEILTYSLKRNSGALRFANRKLLSEKEWAKLVVMANPLSLEKMSDFNEDLDIVSIALEKNEQSYTFVGKKLRKNINFLISIINENYKLYTVLDEDLQKDEDICIGTWRAICASYVKEHDWFLSSIKNEDVARCWEEYQEKINPPNFCRFPDYFNRMIKGIG